MSDERLILITDSTGASLKRWSISLRTLRRIALVASLLGIATLGCLLHGVVLHPRASETSALKLENTRLIDALEQRRNERAGLLNTDWKLSAIKRRLWRESSLGSSIPLDTSLTKLVGEEEPVETDTIARPFVEIDRDYQLYERQAFETLSHFRDTKVLLRNTPSLRPARSPWITSRFGPRRDPVTGKPAMHKGLDLGGYTGMPIIAPADGKVVYAGMRGGFGITVVLDHGFGVQTHFGHLSALHVEYGETVKRGSTIGEMGSTGKSTGTHLHYEARRWGIPLDPEPFMLN